MSHSTPATAPVSPTPTPALTPAYFVDRFSDFVWEATTASRDKLARYELEIDALTAARLDIGYPIPFSYAAEHEPDEPTFTDDDIDDEKLDLYEAAYNRALTVECLKRLNPFYAHFVFETRIEFGNPMNRAAARLIFERMLEKWPSASRELSASGLDVEEVLDELSR